MVLVMALVLAPAASAANVATPKMNAVASWAAGKPVTVWCENDSDAWSRRLAGLGAHTDAGGYAIFGGSEALVGPSACRGLIGGIRDSEFGPSLLVLLHEATHARGWRDEALTECAARVLMYSALETFYDVPFFSDWMSIVTRNALRASLAAPAQYQGGCDRL